MMSGKDIRLLRIPHIQTYPQSSTSLGRFSIVSRAGCDVSLVGITRFGKAENGWSELVEVHEIPPPGTRMVIPETIMQEYRKEEHLWGRPFNYLSYHYTFVRPSVDSPGDSIYYFPLSRADGEDIGGLGKIVLVSLLTLAKTEEPDAFVIAIR